MLGIVQKICYPNDILQSPSGYSANVVWSDQIFHKALSLVYCIVSIMYKVLTVVKYTSHWLEAIFTILTISSCEQPLWSHDHFKPVVTIVANVMFQYNNDSFYNIEHIMIILALPIYAPAAH